MPTYVRYLIQHLAWPTLLITGSLTCIIWLTQALRFIDFIVNRGLSVGDFVYITSLLFPSLLTLLVPVSLFIAIVFTYNKLLGDSELTVLRAVGLSRWQLTKPALIVAAGTTLFCYFLTLYLMPLANRQFNDMRAFLRDNYTSVLLQEEVFNTPVDGLTIFVRERDKEGNLSGILVHDNRNPDDPITMMAEQGKLMQGERGPQFYLEQGIRQERRQHRVSWLNFDNYTLDISFYTKIADARERDEDEKYLGELLSDSSDNPQARAEAHQRIVWPLYNIALALMALAILLNGEFNRRGQWKRIIAASAGSLLVALTGIGLRNLAVNNPMMIPLLYLTVTAIIFGALFSLFASRQRTIPPHGEFQ
ncbi:MAG: LPS export ABC transporter permease LptF [Rickettsiales bacterium]|nr:LPS export ABC transporter permease LptF [Rickettsiales bacterium]